MIIECPNKKEAVHNEPPLYTVSIIVAIKNYTSILPASGSEIRKDLQNTVHPDLQKYISDKRLQLPELSTF